MRPDDGAVDHVGGGISLDHLRQAFQHRVKGPDLQPAAVAPENAVPFAIFVRKMPPLRTCPRQPHHAFEITAVVLRRPTATSALRRQQRPDDRPFLILQNNPLAQGFLQKEALNQSPSLTSTFVHDA